MDRDGLDERSNQRSDSTYLWLRGAHRLSLPHDDEARLSMWAGHTHFEATRSGTLDSPGLARGRLWSNLRRGAAVFLLVAAGWAAQRRNEAELTIAARHLEELENANATGDVKAYLRANYTFHFSIYRAARSENLLSIIENLWLQISPYFNMLHGSGNYSTANEWHREMVSALRDRDVELIMKAVRADIDAAYAVLVARLD